ncbi:MAG: sensor histidine kinase, partial [Flavobacteriales bacterium]
LLRQKKLADIKSDFINNMTHEFKTPIATISLAVDSLQNPKVNADPEKSSYFMQIIREENRRMNSQVERVLQMAQIDKGELKLKLQDVDLHRLIQHAIAQIRIQVDNRQGQIHTHLEATDPHLTGDPVHLSNLVFNLLDNANKYSLENPSITISTKSDDYGIFLSVSDKGIGMSKETQKRIFEPFYRVPTGNVHDIKGFGLGLSYVNAILTGHQGHIRVNSEPGKGSTFECFLPHQRKTA